MALMELSENELSFITGGAPAFLRNANGSYVDLGTHIIYTVAGGDSLRGIATRFGVSAQQICQWNNLRSIDILYVNQKLTI